jgi:ribonuclease HI
MITFQKQHQYTQTAELHFNPSRTQKNHNYLIEEIRKKTIALEKRNWTIIITCIKAHVGTYGNKLADKLVKEAARNDNITF